MSYILTPESEKYNNVSCILCSQHSVSARLRNIRDALQNFITWPNFQKYSCSQDLYSYIIEKFSNIFEYIQESRIVSREAISQMKCRKILHFFFFTEISREENRNKSIHFYLYRDINANVHFSSKKIITSLTKIQSRLATAIPRKISSTRKHVKSKAKNDQTHKGNERNRNKE